ncbi:MAG: hypothetical protein QM811_07470 [Pirellulales bacterium]
MYSSGNRKIHTRSTKCQYRPLFSIQSVQRSSIVVSERPAEQDHSDDDVDRVETGHQEVERREQVAVGDDLLVVVQLGLDVDHVLRGRAFEFVFDLLGRQQVVRELRPHVLELDAELLPAGDDRRQHRLGVGLRRLFRQVSSSFSLT